MILGSIEKNILFSTPTCIRCGKILSEKDDDVMKICKDCKCIK